MEVAPLNLFMCSLTTIKTKHKRPVFFTTSDIWQFQNASAVCPSVHYQSIFIDIGMSLLSHYIVAPMHTVRHKCDKGKQGSSFSCYEISGRQGQIPRKWHPKQWDYPHVLHVFCPQGQQSKAVTAPPAFVLGLQGSVTSRYSLFPSVVAKSLERKFISSKYFLFFFFFAFFCVYFLQLRFSCSSSQNRFSSKIAIKSLWKFMSIVAAIWTGREKEQVSISFTFRSSASDKFNLLLHL